MDRELSEMLQAEYAKRGIKFYLSHKVTGVHGTEVSVEKDGETFTLHDDKVLLSVGRRPVTKGFGLETLAPETFRNGVKVNEYMQTSLPNVYACGDITAFSLLAHTAVSEAEVAVYESGDRRCREDRGGVAGRRYFVYREKNTDGILWAFCRGE